MAAVTPLYTVEEYEALVAAGALGPDDNIELLLGVIVAVSPQGPRHGTVLMLGAQTLTLAAGGRAAVRTQLPFRAGRFSMPEPDIALVPGRLTDYIRSHPTRALLLVEVSDSSLRQDQMTKAAIYAEAGVPEYWIIDLASDTVIVHTDPDPGARRYRTQARSGRGERIALSALDDAVVAVDDLLGPPD